jgi:hypothetical protein
MSTYVYLDSVPAGKVRARVVDAERGEAWRVTHDETGWRCSCNEPDCAHITLVANVTEQ